MLVGLFSVRDLVAEDFGPIYQAKNGKVAARQCIGMLRHQLQQFPDLSVNDYRLYYLGDYDTDTGKIDPLLEPKIYDLDYSVLHAREVDDE